MTDPSPTFTVEQSTAPETTLYEDPATILVPQFQPSDLQEARRDIYNELRDRYEMHDGNFIVPPPATDQDQAPPSPPPEYLVPGEEVTFDEVATITTIEMFRQDRGLPVYTLAAMVGRIGTLFDRLKNRLKR